MATLITAPIKVFTDLNGDALENGKIYLGEELLDPEANPIVAYWDKSLAAGTEVLQPIRTLSGRPCHNGAPKNVYIAESSYSITVRDKNHNLVETLLSVHNDSDTGGASSSESIPRNRVVSGANRIASEQPAFLSIDGGTPGVTVLGGDTELNLVINGDEVTIESDILVSSLTLAPSTNNTCLVDEPDFIDQTETKYAGEGDSILHIGTVGSEITSRVGQTVALQKNGSSEIMLAHVKSTTELTDIRRGWFYDENEDPLVRETLADGDQLNLLSLGWLFAQNDTVTVDVSYRTPIKSYSQPISPSVGDYWEDLVNWVWKRYDSSWVQINRTLIGMVAIGTVKTEGKREIDYFHDYRDTNTVDLEVFSDEVVRSKGSANEVFVYSKILRISPNKIEWDNTLNMETGVIAASTRYYLYLGSGGKRIVSSEKYYDRKDLYGKYHPYEAWRCVGEALTDSTSDWLNSWPETMQGFKSAKIEYTDLVAKYVTDDTVDVDIKKLKLLDKDNNSIVVDNIDLTGDATTSDMYATRLASHWYQIHIAAKRDKTLEFKFVADLTGTCTTDTTNKLVDSAADFVTQKVPAGSRAIAFNHDDNTWGYVETVDDLNTLGFATDLFPDGNESYTIHILEPEFSADFIYSANTGAVYNDAASNFDNFKQVNSFVSIEKTAAVVTANNNAYEKKDIANIVPITAVKCGGSLVSLAGSGTFCFTVGVASDAAGLGVDETGMRGVTSGLRDQTTSFNTVISEKQAVYAKVAAGGSYNIDVSRYEI